MKAAQDVLLSAVLVAKQFKWHGSILFQTDVYAHVHTNTHLLHQGSCI